MDTFKGWKVNENSYKSLSSSMQLYLAMGNEFYIRRIQNRITNQVIWRILNDGSIRYVIDQSDNVRILHIPHN
mgnify:CR=1 FL=1